MISAIVDALTVLQRADSANPSEPIWNAVDQGQIAAGNVNVLRGLRESGVVSDLGPSESLTIDIVSLLFDYILDDPAIPDALKALIGRLQIPVLKVAMLDKDVFSKKTHPARRLLDAFAGASIDWSEGLRQQDALYDKIEEIVRRIVAEFDDDVDVFQQVLDEFNAFIEEESQAADMRAEKSSQSLHTKERIVLTKMEVDKQINARFDGREIREFVSHFVLDYWRQLLIITHIEVGADSDEWRGQMQTIDDLVRSVQAKKTPAERKKLTTRLPKLIKDIKRGMQKLEMEPVQCSKFLSMLASVHVVAVKNVEETSIAERKLADADDRLRIERQAAQARGEIGPSSEEFIKKGLARLFERQGVEETELDIDLSLFESADESAQDEQTDSIDTNIMEFVQMVTTLDLGDWIEFEDADDVTLRARFTWISPSTGRYLFTTRQGQRALDTTLQELAEQFQRGHARIIESAPDALFDRAIGDLIEKLEAGAASA